MKEPVQPVSSSELRKNLAAGAGAGGALGVAFGIGYESLLLGVPVGILFGLAIGYRLSRMPIKMRYPMYMTRRMLLAGALFMLTSSGYLYALDNGWSGGQAVLAAIPAIVAWGLLVVVIGSAIASLDELQRRIQTEAIAIGFAGTAIVAMGYGLLEFAGVAQVNWGLIPLVMGVMWLAGKLWTMWRYR